MSHLRRWGAVYLLVLLFAGSWFGQFVSQLNEYHRIQQVHRQPFEWPGFWANFFASTFENWQSEWLQLVFQAILLLGAKHLLFRADAADIERIERKIDQLCAATPGNPGSDIDSAES
ncbi:DUF6766 family protein [Nocardia abscessus]|uniref:DUF6766 family protein n=1 Tax=Nocardia abscessus TaxID=120957 RepID=UPI0002E4D074|nr:DUF6766 family protein [Nocardia abscessus]MCC3331100.1 hypothetical protein [Nocardia abscessus]